jgi:drug/metabolite transporter (DMT)-like permease
MPTPASPLQATPHRWTAYLLLGMSMSLVGIYVALTKPLVLVFPVFLLGWIRFGIAGLAMWPWLKKPADEAPMTRNTRQLVFLESFLGNFLFSICMLYGVSMTSAVSAGIIMAAIPAVVALLSWGFLREKIGLRVWGAIACSAFGIALFSLSKSEHTAGSGSTLNHHQAWLGNLLVFGAVICEAAYAVIGKKLIGTLSPKRISALINLWGFVLMTPLGFYLALSFEFSAVAPAIWLLMVFYALAASVGTVWLWMTGLKTIPAAKAGVFTVMLPISAALVGVLFMDERLSEVQFLAFGIALLGVVLATLPQSSKPATAPVSPDVLR